MTNNELEGGDAYVFLDVEDPVVAWAAARGVLLSARHVANLVDDTALPVSLMMAGLLRENHRRFFNERIIDDAREKYGPKETSSRLWGMFCFPDLQSVNRLLDGSGWGAHFSRENLVAVRVEGAGLQHHLDSNWITYAPLTTEGVVDRNRIEWLDPYWRGEPYPHADPIWEAVIDGRITVLGTSVRKRAYDNAAAAFPKARVHLELSRIAAWNGYDLGSITPFLFDEGNRWACRYYMNLMQAEDPQFLDDIAKHFADGEGVNREFLKPFFESQGDPGPAPDLMPYAFGGTKPALANAE